MKLGEYADVVRSKNAGIYRVTIDVMFDDPARYETFKQKNEAALAPAVWSERYGVPVDEVECYWYDAGLAYKITIPTKITSGSPGDSDIRGAQQHVPVYNFEIAV